MATSASIRRARKRRPHALPALAAATALAAVPLAHAAEVHMDHREVETTVTAHAFPVLLDGDAGDNLPGPPHEPHRETDRETRITARRNDDIEGASDNRDLAHYEALVARRHGPYVASGPPLPTDPANFSVF